MTDSLKIINRQKAEIDELQRRIVFWREDMKYRPAAIRAEAIKDFAERLKGKFKNLECNSHHTKKTVSVEQMDDQVNWVLHTVTADVIDNLVKEMTEGKDNEIC